MAVSTVMALLPLTMALIRFIGTLSARPSSFRLTPISFSSSRSNSPGWMGGSCLLRSITVSLLVVVHDLDIMRIPVAPGETDSPAAVDSNAVLTGPDAFRRLQPVAADGRQVREAGGGIEPPQPLARPLFDPAKPPASESVVDRLSLQASKRTDHTHQPYYVRRSGSTGRMGEALPCRRPGCELIDP